MKYHDSDNSSKIKINLIKSKHIEKLAKLRGNDFYRIISLVKNIVPEFKREVEL